MKIIQSSLFRALIAIIVGALLIKYREQTVTWITISIGVLFFLSGIISCASYYSAKRQTADTFVFDDEGNRLTPLRPAFPIVGLGSLILGVILAFMPSTFVNGLVYILAAILILGAVSQFVMLASVTKFAHIGFYYWIVPSLILLIGIVAIVHPAAIASAPFFIIGWCMMIYGVTECINALKIHNINKAQRNKTIENNTEETNK